MNYLDINHIVCTIMGYPLSYIELLGTLSGLISVYYASRGNVLTWPTGIINEIALAILFYQVQLYADMFLQVFFFVVTIFGWYHWKSNKADVPITRLRHKKWYLLSLGAGTLLLGTCIKNLPQWLPVYFPHPAAYPYIDSFVTVASILATILLAKKQLENWIFWIVVDVISVGLYQVKGINFLSIEYVIFLGLASWGLWQWHKKLRYA
ncbi:nicotinamide riboside transporter PnuC [Chitinophaga sancti]|uniref:Nicotinamide riboside transporter PnuC n=1 Tax=Chitinophaga sancti TaxID=1004 RepID=A0A1K1QY54_9BACT|nr:nicotinamide riboside transporter PnuC [Chitinophaga sancti]WQD62019.1 nicotinamide riboside transporter PnuC [Chitinophaga sancti]WQG92412.1 nicotinamide riboside transporter PnuC [Chitinophaga sancti]SFW64238.1 nicotinamide mononucleotide transporter [Chitinophaga sancti]